MMKMMQMKKKHQEASEETRLIKTTEEADVGDEINPYSQDEKWASSSAISVALKKYSGGWCMIYGPWGDCVFCSHVACPASNRETTTCWKSKDLQVDEGDKAASQRLMKRSHW